MLFELEWEMDPSWPEYAQRKLNFPPLNEILAEQIIFDGTNDITKMEAIDLEDQSIIGKTDMLLDVAIAGHSKCATSYVMKWLHSIPQVRMWREEVCLLNENRPATLARKLYEDFPSDGKTWYLRGLKCPGPLNRRSLKQLQAFYPRARVIVGLRHPIRYFESFYNFRTRHPKFGGLPAPLELMGACNKMSQGVCTDRAKFHHNLALFGKTNLSEVERDLLLGPSTNSSELLLFSKIIPIRNPVFLYDVMQLYDANVTRVARFQADLQRYLGLNTALQPPDAPRPMSFKPKQMDICRPEYTILREELLRIGASASKWIRKYFLKSDEVFVSNPEHFDQILDDWGYDPCTK